jgi:hypothetical protein
LNSKGKLPESKILAYAKYFINQYLPAEHRVKVPAVTFTAQVTLLKVPLLTHRPMRLHHEYDELIKIYRLLQITEPL